MKVAIVGSRKFEDYDRLRGELDRLLAGQTVDAVVSGGAVGADTLAERYAADRGLAFEVFLPDWERHGEKAGPKRNAQIVAAADLVVAFWDGASTGTRNTLERARAAGKPVVVVDVGTGGQP